MRAIFLILYLATVSAVPSNPQRIVGGSVTTISQYPSIVSLLYSWNSVTFWQTCSGTILNTRSILTAAHCPAGDAVGRWRVRVGSTFANSGGLILGLANILVHTAYDGRTLDNDIGIIRTSAVIAHNAAVMPAPIAGANYIPADNLAVRAIGWGFTSGGGVPSEQLRQVYLKIFNQEECKKRYNDIDETITDNMLCSSWLDAGTSSGQCRGDNGSPLFHNDVVVGVYSWGRGCAHPHFPAVNARVSRYTVWIHANA